MVKTKIICTLGPASDTESIIRKMMFEGMDVVRLNFSHGSHSEHQRRVDIVKRLNKKYGRHLRVIQDLEGYRIRVGGLNGREIPLTKKQVIFLAGKGALLKQGAVPFDYDGSLLEIKPGNRIFIDDGNIALVVISCTEQYLKTEVLIPGILKEHKGINMPDTRLKFKGLTEKDKKDIEFGIKNRVDFIAQSFVRNKADMLFVRELVYQRHSSSSC